MSGTGTECNPRGGEREFLSELTPFSQASVPSPLMIAWAAAYAAVMLVVALTQFQRRAL